MISALPDVGAGVEGYGEDGASRRQPGEEGRQVQREQECLCHGGPRRVRSRFMVRFGGRSKLEGRPER